MGRMTYFLHHDSVHLQWDWRKNQKEGKKMSERLKTKMYLTTEDERR